jgi:hypothetical protein
VVASRRAVLLGLGAVLTGCGRFPTPTPVAPASSKNIVIVSAAGKLVTSTPEGATTRVPPTPTFDPSFSSVLTPLAGTPTETPIGIMRSPTPELRPTRTIAPTLTTLPTVEIPPTATRVPPGAVIPTRTSGPATATRPPAATPIPTRTSTPTPVDPLERTGNNNDLSRATALTLGKDLTGLLSSPADVDVFKFDIDDDTDNLQIVATITGADMESYRMFLISPGRRSAAFGTPVGTTSRHVVVPVRQELGTWYVELSPTPNGRVPRGSYTLRVTTRSLTEPAPQEPEPDVG